MTRTAPSCITFLFAPPTTTLQLLGLTPVASPCLMLLCWLSTAGFSTLSMRQSPRRPSGAAVLAISLETHSSSDSFSSYLREFGSCFEGSTLSCVVGVVLYLVLRPLDVSLSNVVSSLCPLVWLHYPLVVDDPAVGLCPTLSVATSRGFPSRQLVSLTSFAFGLRSTFLS